MTGWLLAKYAITALLVVLIGEVARRIDRLGGLVAALPWVTVLALVWMHAEGQPLEKLARHAQYTLWYVIPTLPMSAGPLIALLIVYALGELALLCTTAFGTFVLFNR